MTDQSAPELYPLDPAYVTTMRIAWTLAMIPFLIGAGVLEFTKVFPTGVVIVPVLILAIGVAFILPARQYRHWGYALGSDRLRIVRGHMFFRDTIVPLGRIQHIDVDQGPVDQRFDLARLTVHTAGNHNSRVTLPGLRHADALAMRETIRAAIRQDAM